MHATAIRSGVVPKIGRTTLLREIRISPASEIIQTYKFTTHPAHKIVLEGIREQIRVNANLLESLAINEFPAGFQIEVSQIPSWWAKGVTFPEGISISVDQVFMFSESQTLNEFGYYYVATYIAGMFARYYPDLWSKHIEYGTQLYHLVEMLCATAVERAPLHLLQVFEKCVFVSRPGQHY
jgi:hypothetical protein